jgi:simple sugar transport system permease protein
MTATSPPTSPPAEGPPSTAAGFVDRVLAAMVAGTPTSRLLIPVASVLAALVIGAILIGLEGVNPFAVYWSMVKAVAVDNRGFSDTATAATPLILLGLGYALAYRARIFTIGGEGQYLVGATAGAAWVTAGGIRDLPSVFLIVTGLAFAVIAGALWSALAAWALTRFGANVTISSLMLVYVGAAIMAWGIRAGFKDPEAFVNQSRAFEGAALPDLPGTSTHIGFLLAVLLVPAFTVLLYRHRSGFHATALGYNPQALDVNEVASGRVTMAIMLAAGALAGLAGMVETAGVNNRLTASASLGYGFTAIVVALLGRLHPVGVLVSGLGLAGLTIGLEAAEREFTLPSSLVGVIIAMIVVFVVVGDALAARGSETQ